MYKRIKSRRGPKKAIVAVARKILISIYWMFKTGKPYKELGINQVNQKNKKKQIEYHVKKLQSLGLDVKKSLNLDTCPTI